MELDLKNATQNADIFRRMIFQKTRLSAQAVGMRVVTVEQHREQKTNSWPFNQSPSAGSCVGSPSSICPTCTRPLFKRPRCHPAGLGLPRSLAEVLMGSLEEARLDRWVRNGYAQQLLRAVRQDRSRVIRGERQQPQGNWT